MAIPAPRRDTRPPDHARRHLIRNSFSAATHWGALSPRPTAIAVRPGAPPTVALFRPPPACAPRTSGAAAYRCGSSAGWNTSSGWCASTSVQPCRHSPRRIPRNSRTVTKKCWNPRPSRSDVNASRGRSTRGWKKMCSIGPCQWTNLSAGLVTSCFAVTVGLGRLALACTARGCTEHAARAVATSPSAIHRRTRITRTAGQCGCLGWPYGRHALPAAR